jgi:hypothetical protein
MAPSDETVLSAAGREYEDAPAGWLTGGGTSGNERLTTAVGATLIVLLAVIGVTIVRIHALLSVHLFVGMLLIPPVLLKLSSTGYRFVRYYTANPRYRRKGPPPLALRMLAPLVVLSTLVVLVSGRADEFTSDVTGRAGRVLALAGALVAGVVLAILVIPDFSAWTSGSCSFHLAFHHGR